ncbi:MAG: hypothetical protein MUD12_01430 [Spirochaetes bacterium]|jgi:hypothetical protein|nr:hypothetical protein [Spirochaetota bacterium]
MKAALRLGLVFMSLLLVFGCKKKNEPNRVDMDQIDIDRSTNYRHVFKDMIEDDERNQKKYKRDTFKRTE